MSLDNPTPLPESADAEALFLRRLMIAAFSLGLVALAIWLLREFQTFLQPLFVAVFVSYVVLPAHRWLVRHGIPSTIAYVVLLAVLLSGLIGLGTLVYSNIQRLVERLPEYELRLRRLLTE